MRDMTRGSAHGMVRRIARGLILAGALLIAAVAAAWVWAHPDTPGPFLSSASLSATTAAPGTLLATEAYSRDVPAGARAWRILYATTRISGESTVASAVVMVPAGAKGRLPVISWAHGTTGTAPGCAPSIMAPFANVPALPDLLAQGWAYVATDYAGLGTPGGHAYLVGREAAQSVLDAMRAARAIAGINLSDATVVWGHSQGGNSALWAGMIAPAYAPDLRVLGVAGLAPATDLPDLLRTARVSVFGKIVSAYLIAGYSLAYPDVRGPDYTRGLAGAIGRDIAGRCAGGPATLVSVAEALLLPADGLFSRDPAQGPLGDRLRQNVPGGPYAMPVLIAQGQADDLVLEPVQSAFAARLCQGGVRAEYRRYPGRDHLSLVAPGSPLTADLIGWTRARLSGDPTAGNCG